MKSARTRSPRASTGLSIPLKERLDELRQSRARQSEEIPRPKIVFVGPEDHDVSPLEELLSKADIVEVVDRFEEMLEELLYCRQPPLKEQVRAGAAQAIAQRDNFVQGHLGDRHPWAVGSWVYLPWRRTLLRLLPETLHQELRTARNRGWIEPDEQAAFADVTVGIVGLSVGSNMALALAQEGGPRRMKLADFDRLAGTNLNRIRATLADLGIPKTHLVARQIYELDPYAELFLFPEGVNEGNIGQFFDGPPCLNAVIDECDDPITKIKLRLEAKARRIPLLMATDMGDDVMLDVERYDLDAEYPLLHGRLGPQPERWLERDLTPQERLQLVLTFIGLDCMPQRMVSVGQRLGRDLDGPPQLGGTCSMGGAVVSHVLRQIFADSDEIAGRFRAGPMSPMLPP